MIVICVHTVVVSNDVQHLTGATVNIEDVEATRLLALGAVRLPGSPDPWAGKDMGGNYPGPEVPYKGIYQLPSPYPAW